MLGRTAMRTAILALEMAFIVAVAVVAGVVEHLGWWTLVPVAGAWALTLVSERLSGRLAPRSERAPRRRRPAAAGTVAVSASAGGESHVRVVAAEPGPEPAAVQDGGVAPEQPVETPVSPPEPERAPERESEPVAAEPEPEPEPEPVAPETVAPVLSVVPPPEPEPQPVAAQPVSVEPADAEVVPLVQRGPQVWNIWDLERLSRQYAGSDAFRDEERAYLLVYLREFASPEGVLPPDFDALVRESFGDLVGTG